jgi:signal transduction histidine kinase
LGPARQSRHERRRMKHAAGRSFTTRLTLALAVLLLTYGALVALLGRHVASEHEQESLQRLSHGLARHIVEHWPQIAAVDQGQAQRDQADRAARDALMSMLMVVNPGVQVYVLDADGRVNAYIGEPGMVREHQVDLIAVRAFLAGGALPLRGTDPMGSGIPRIFSAAMFAPRDGDTRPPGYLYVVLDGQARDQVTGQLSLRRVWEGAGWAALVGLVVTLALGAFAFQKLTQPLRRLAASMRDYKLRDSPVNLVKTDVVSEQSQVGGDEVLSLANAFDHMTKRLEAQAAREQEQSHAHRETMAGVAHDLRTPLTALHGHLEALAGPAFASSAHTAEVEGIRCRVLSTALAQSNKVRRLSQQLFELATLQSSDEVRHPERFFLDELVSDAVQKFDLQHPHSDAESKVTLSGEAPGRMTLHGDLQLIERALTNLIDNAVRHAGTASPVRVSLSREGLQAHIVIEDRGPGLPEELTRRLEAGLSVREPPVPRAGGATGGNFGGLGLAIAQRVAVLHGGTLRALPMQPATTQGGKCAGTRMCLVLPLAV